MELSPCINRGQSALVDVAAGDVGLDRELGDPAEEDRMDVKRGLRISNIVLNQTLTESEASRVGQARPHPVFWSFTVMTTVE